MTGRGRTAVLALVVAAAAAAAYLPALGHGFAYDDHRFVERNPHLDAVAAAPWRAFDPAVTTEDGAEPGMWRPLRTAAFAWTRALGGPGPAAAHGVSMILHGVATALVFAVAAALGAGDLGAAVGASLFAFHPAQAESVAWVSSQGDLLAGVLSLAAVLCHLRGRRWPVPLLALFAFLAKESAVALPLLLIVADLAAGGAPRARANLRVAGATAAVLVAASLARWFALRSADAAFGQGEGMGLGTGGMLAALPSLLGWYAWRTLVPLPGTYDQQVAPGALLSLGFLLLLGALAAWRRFPLPVRTAGPARVAAAWALAALAPVTLLQVAFPLRILAADRFLYLALAGPCVAAGAAVGALGPAVARAGLCAAPLLLVATFPAAVRWRSDEALWRDTLERQPGHPRALYGVAATEADPARSLPLLEAYLERVPGDAGAWYLRGAVEEALGLAAADAPTHRGRMMQAARSFSEAAGIWGRGEPEGRRRGYTAARLARACVLAAIGDDVGAEEEAGRAAGQLRSEPDAVRVALAPRVAVLRRWARERDRVAVLQALDRAEGPR